MSGLKGPFIARIDQGPDSERGLWHMICDRSRPSSARNFIIQNNIPGFVFRGPPKIFNRPPVPGLINLVVDPDENLAGAIFEGLDYEAIYILYSSIFGHGDFGRLTATLNGTWLSRAELQNRLIQNVSVLRAKSYRQDSR